MAAAVTRLLGRRTSLLIPIAQKSTSRAHLLASTARQRTRSLQTSALLRKDDISVTYVFPDGAKVTAKGKEGDNLLDIAINNDVEIDGFGACEGTLACSTCHLIFDQEVFDKLPDEATDEELDMLDLAYGLTDTSRLGCQVCISKELDGIEVKIPEGIHDQR